MIEPINVSHTGEQVVQNKDDGIVDPEAEVKSPIKPSDNTVASESLEQRLIGMDDKLSSLLQLFQERIQDDHIKEQLFEKLYNDLAKYREDFVFKNITQRIFNDVILLFDRVDGMLKDEILGQMQRGDLIDHIRSFRKEIIQVLSRHEVSLIESNLGTFDETFQEALSTRSVMHPEEDQGVIEVLVSGFKYKGRLLRPEKVIIGKFSDLSGGDNNG